MWMLVYLIWLTVKSKLSLLTNIDKQNKLYKKEHNWKIVVVCTNSKRKVDIWEKRKKIPGLGE